MVAFALIERPSPNFDGRPKGRAVDILLLHYTGLPRAADALARLCDPAAKVSAHYLIDEDGTTYRLVGEAKRAWHAGQAAWRGEADINGASIGIELVNPGHAYGYRPFPPAQMAVLVALARAILARHPVPPRNVLGHSDVACARKEDPGELFDWRALAKEGIGLWPHKPIVRGETGLALKAGDAGAAVRSLQEALSEYGYEVRVSGVFDEATAAVVRAFQRHFRPERLDGIADPETCQLAFQLATLAG